MNKTLLILDKEWQELRQDKMLLSSTLLLPLALAFLAVGLMYGIGRVPANINITGMSQFGTLSDPALAELTPGEQAQLLAGKQVTTLFLLMPLLIPTILAAYSIVGEKTRRTLEPLLAAPIRTQDLLFGKCLAALIPAIAVTWLSSAIFVAGMACILPNPALFAALITPAWLLVLVLCAPLLGLITVAISVFISSRVNDPRTAQQISGVLVVPLLALIFCQVSGALVISPLMAVATAFVLTPIAASFIFLATRLFQRETILTRWR